MAFIVKREIISAPTTLPLSTAQVRLNTSILVSYESNGGVEFGNITLDLHPSSTNWYTSWGGGCNETHITYEVDRWRVRYFDNCNYTDYLIAEKIASAESLPVNGYTMGVIVDSGSINIIAV
jgi:hypothetical protein